MIDFNVDLQLYLPHNWILVTLDICQNTGDLLISKLTKGHQIQFYEIAITEIPFKFGFSTIDAKF